MFYKGGGTGQKERTKVGVGGLGVREGNKRKKKKGTKEVFWVLVPCLSMGDGWISLLGESMYHDPPLDFLFDFDFWFSLFIFSFFPSCFSPFLLPPY